jgi:hypothetical protein
MCLLSFFRRDKSIYNEAKWVAGFKVLLAQKHKGILLSTCALMSGVIKQFGGMYELIPQIIDVIANIDTAAEDY